MRGAATQIDARGREPLVGDRIEKYEFVRSVARGGMGSVWAAKLHGPHGFEKTVAIKTVLPELAGDPGVRAMFLDEARLASAIEHRNVARGIDFLEHEGALYLVMEWVEGLSLMALHQRMAQRDARIPIGIALRILADVCAGLHAAHELQYANGEPCGLVHRDVSPPNVLVAGEGSAKLIDFGVAIARFRAAPDTVLGQLRGRLEFMAPEQAHTEPLDRRADIWSVGATLFYLLTGHGPFGACDPTELLRRLLAGAQPMPPPAHVHPAVARILTGCLTRRREDRFPTAEHLGWAIEEAIEELGVAATAGDVARFVADHGGQSGSAVVTGRCAIPQDMTVLGPTEVSGLRFVGKRAVSWRRALQRGLAALACVSAIGLAAAATSKALASGAPPLSDRAAQSGDEAPAVRATAEDEIALHAVLAPRSQVKSGSSAHPHAKPHPRQEQSKAGASHEQSDGPR